METQPAQARASEIASTPAAVQLAPAELEEFRAQPLTMMERLGQAPGMEPAKIDAAVERVRSAGTVELSRLHRSFARLPNW